MALKGVRTWGANPRLMLWGLIPGVITLVIFGAGAVVLISRIVDISGAIAGALVSGDGWWADAVQVVAALAVLGAAAVVGIYTFTAVTLLIGQPFFEKLSREVDRAHGFEGSDPEESVWAGTWRGVGEALRIAALSIPVAIGLFLIGLIPVIGGLTAFCLGAAFGGWFLTLELTAYPLARRGIVPLSQRRAVLKPRRAQAVGFGASVFLLFLIPLGAVFFMPAAVAGATHMVRGATADNSPNSLAPMD